MHKSTSNKHLLFFIIHFHWISIVHANILQYLFWRNVKTFFDVIFRIVIIMHLKIQEIKWLQPIIFIPIVISLMMINLTCHIIMKLRKLSRSAYYLITRVILTWNMVLNPRILSCCYSWHWIRRRDNIRLRFFG